MRKIRNYSKLYSNMNDGIALPIFRSSHILSSHYDVEDFRLYFIKLSFGFCEV